MTKEITKANILQELQDKFNMREYSPAPFLFDETVVPVYEISEHLRRWIPDVSDKNITAIGGIVFFTVPDNERWDLGRYTVVKIGGTYKFAGVYIARKGFASYFTYLDLTASQTVSYAIDLPKNVSLLSGDTLGINIDDFTAEGHLRLYIDYRKEEIR